MLQTEEPFLLFGGLSVWKSLDQTSMYCSSSPNQDNEALLPPKILHIIAHIFLISHAWENQISDGWL